MTDRPRDAAPDGTDGSPQPSGADATTPLEEQAARSEIDDLRRALEERDAQYVRLAADFENFRRRSAQESSDRARYAAEAAAVALLPVLDNLQRAIQHAPEGDPMVDGVRMVARQFEDALRSIGVTRIEAVGQPFDPTVHDAIGGEESPEVERDTVVEELQPGYRLHDRVLRPALVRVAHPVAR
jgi:molecular chaperone GrpE